MLSVDISKYLDTRLKFWAFFIPYAVVTSAIAIFAAGVLLAQEAIVMANVFKMMEHMPKESFWILPIGFVLISFPLFFLFGRLYVTFSGKLAGSKQVQASRIMAIVGSIGWIFSFLLQIALVGCSLPGVAVPLCSLMFVAGMVNGVLSLRKTNQSGNESVAAA